MSSAASSQGQEEDLEFADEAKEKFQEQTRRRTQSGQVDVLHTLITGGNGNTHTHTHTHTLLHTRL